MEWSIVSGGRGGGLPLVLASMASSVTTKPSLIFILSALRFQFALTINDENKNYIVNTSTGTCTVTLKTVNSRK